MNFHALGILLAIAAASIPSVAGRRTRNCQTSCRDKGDQTYPVYEVGFSDVQKSLIIASHNELRHSVTKGRQEVSGGEKLPPATSFPSLYWDDQLQMQVQEELRSVCEWDSVEGPDQIRSTIQGWVDESRYFEGCMIEEFPDDPRVKSFAQMIWQNATAIGCALFARTIDGEQRQKFACKYDREPVVGDRVYQDCPVGDECCLQSNFPVFKKGLEEGDEEAIVEMHNAIRKGQEGGECVGELKWSDELALFAQGRVDVCEHERRNASYRFSLAGSVHGGENLPPLDTAKTIIEGKWRGNLEKIFRDNVDGIDIGCGFNVVWYRYSSGKRDYTRYFLCYYEPRIEGEEVPKEVEEAVIEGDEVPKEVEEAVIEGDEVPKEVEEAVIQGEEVPKEVEEAVIEGDEVPKEVEEAVIEGDEVHKEGEEAGSG